MAYDYRSIKIEGIDVESILECKVEARMGDHTSLRLKAILKEETEDQIIYQLGDRASIRVYIQTKEEEKELFNGIVTDIAVKYVANVYWLILEAKSATYLLDIAKHSRSFQDLSMTYHQVIEELLKKYSGVDCIVNIPYEPITTMLVQYEETDWQFIKRITSTFNESLFPAVDKPGIKFYVGVAQMPKKLEIITYHLKKDLNTYYYVNANTLKSISEDAYCIYEVQSYQIAYLMDNITHNGKTLYIKQLTTEIRESLLVSHYDLQPKEGLSIARIYPMHLVGVAIEGEILVPQAENVKVHLRIDQSQDVAKACWIPYSTMSASTDGSGWYCMPEVGDTVRVYFPTKYTKDAVALSAVSIYDEPTGGEDRMQNPDVKYLGTVHDKEMKLAPEGIRISCNGNIAVLSVGEDGKISLYGDKSIVVVAEENLIINAKQDINMTALERVEFACDKGAKFVLDQAGNIVIQGTEVKVD